MTSHRSLIVRLLEAFDAGDQPLYAETFREIERSHKEAGVEIRAKQVGDTRLVKLTPPGQRERTS
mgnify:FL=1